MLIGATVITILVAVLLYLAMTRPARPVREHRWTMGWGLGFTGSVLAVLLGFGLFVGEQILHRDDDTIRVEAYGRQWDWRFVQPGPDGPVETMNVLYVPAGQPFDVVIRSDDVIHSFWVPRLGGKMDAVPGHTNILRLQADTPGEYEGRSAEFSGVGYAGMTFRVIAYDPANPPAIESQP